MGANRTSKLEKSERGAERRRKRDAVPQTSGRQSSEDWRDEHVSTRSLRQTARGTTHRSEAEAAVKEEGEHEEGGHRANEMVEDSEIELHLEVQGYSVSGQLDGDGDGGECEELWTESHDADRPVRL